MMILRVKLPLTRLSHTAVVYVTLPYFLRDGTKIPNEALEDMNLFIDIIQDISNELIQDFKILIVPNPDRQVEDRGHFLKLFRNRKCLQKYMFD